MNAPTQSITDDLLAEIEAGNIHGSEWALTPIVNRVRELEKDAARYRWLRVSGCAELYLHNLDGVDNCKQVAGESLGAAIDAAMEPPR